MANVSWSISIQVAGGPTVTAREGPIAAEATDRIEIHVPEKSGSVAGQITVDLQPGPVSSIHFLLIKSSHYGGDGENITFTVGSSTDAIVLSGPQFYSGGAVSRLGPNVQSLAFTNNSGEEAQIEIFIARDATPPLSS